ncbi:MAG: hypothetical protein QF578_04025 [Alphaproteobacteria bacterium]|nr:hypothetical protein [Alphaproteobacteria bacterium]MDP6563969.1 hypothetical protein [Alphaproteobacteria bacterium]
MAASKNAKSLRSMMATALSSPKPRAVKPLAARAARPASSACPSRRSPLMICPCMVDLVNCKKLRQK